MAAQLVALRGALLLPAERASATEAAEALRRRWLARTQTLAETTAAASGGA